MTIQSMTITDDSDAVNRKFCCKPRTRVKLIIGLVVVLIILTALCGYLIGISTEDKRITEPPDPIFPLPPSWSKLYTFQRAAVCTDAPECSKVGRTTASGNPESLSTPTRNRPESNILEKNGSAVDAAIAAMFCNGLMNQQSMGVGGGFIMTVYIKSEQKAYSVIAREKAPMAATADMFHGDHSKSMRSPQSVGVPGEVRGMWAAHRRWGVLPWSELIEPTLEFCRNGYYMSKALHDGLLSAQYIVNDSHLRKTYYDEKRKAFLPPGSTVKPSAALCNTLQRISDRGGDDFYNGSLAADIVEDLTRLGGIITAEDLAQYQPKITAPLAISLTSSDIIYTPPPPSSGVILAVILNILKGYNFTPDSISTTDNMVLTYHRIIEAFKYAYATRTKLGDEDFLDLKELISTVTSPENGEAVRQMINDTMTSNNTAHYGATDYTKDDAGTAHISIIAQNGDAVSVTSSINYYFGIGMTTAKTGIVLNNVMDDFSSPGIVNFFGVQPSPANFISPGKRPLSSMTPSIIVDGFGNAKLVVGASGGTKIITAVALTTMRQLWFGQTIKQAVDAARMHHQIFPMTVEYEYGVLEPVLEGLRLKGHATKRYRGRGSTVCALYRNKTAIYANADFRKGGNVAGMDT